MLILEGDDLRIQRKGGFHNQWGLELIGYTVLGGTSSLITLLNLPAARNLHISVQIFDDESTPIDPRLTFNNDTGANYGYASMDMITSPVAHAGTSNANNLALGPAFNASKALMSTIDISNFQTRVKLGHFITPDQDTTATDGTRPQGRWALCKWGNAADLINRIDIQDGVTSRSYAKDSGIFVYSMPTG